MMENDEREKNHGGGMYRGVNVPVKLLDGVIIAGILAILLVMLFGIIK